MPIKRKREFVPIRLSSSCEYGCVCQASPAPALVNEALLWGEINSLLPRSIRAVLQQQQHPSGFITPLEIPLEFVLPSDKELSTIAQRDPAVAAGGSGIGDAGSSAGSVLHSRQHLMKKIRILDTRLDSYLADIIARHRFVSTGSCRIFSLEDDRSTTVAADPSRMNMDEDLAGAIEAALQPINENEISPESVIRYTLSNVKSAAVYDGSGGVSSFAKALWMLNISCPTASDIKSMLRHECRYVRAVAMFFLRYVVAPEEIIDYFAPVLVDTTVISISDDEVCRVDEYAKRILLEDEVQEAWFPIYPPFALQRVKEGTERALLKPNTSAPTGATATGGTAAAPQRLRFGSALLPGFKSVNELVDALEEARRVHSAGAIGSVFATDVSDEAPLGHVTVQRQQAPPPPSSSQQQHSHHRSDKQGRAKRKREPLGGNIRPLVAIRDDAYLEF